MKLTPLCLCLVGILLTACSDDEQIIIPVETKQKPKLDVLGVASGPEMASLSDTIDEGSQAFFSFRPQLAFMVGVDKKEANLNYEQLMDNFDSHSDLTFRQFLRSKADTLYQIENQKSEFDEDNRLVMANIFNYYSGAKEFEVGYIDSYFGHLPFIINQINGPLVDSIYNFTDGKEILTLQDAKDYVTRVSLLGKQIDQVEQKFIEDANNKWLPPKALLNSTLAYLQSYIEVEVSKHRIKLHLEESLKPLNDISKQDKSLLIDSVTEQLSKHIYPAYQRVHSTVKSYQSKARKADGIWAQPNGSKYYKYMIKAQGDSDLTAEQIHNIGLKEVDRLNADMDSILSQLNYQQGSVSERLVALAREPRFSYEDTEQGRARVIADLNLEIQKINEFMPTMFKTPIKYDVEVKAFPKEIEDGTSGGQYNPPSFDGSKPGVFWINLRDIENLPKFDLPTLTFHETNPGHHWQISLNMALANMPVLRKMAPYNAYIEGWALYAEQVAFEMGMYKDNPFGNLGRLKAEMFRAVRLVVDTGIHHKRWTRNKAIAYMMTQTGQAETEATAEIERYMAWPGQALGYKLGMLKILELRKNAETLLGDNFKLSEFHDVVLLNGALPMEMLEQKVNDWIANK